METLKNLRMFQKIKKYTEIRENSKSYENTQKQV